MSLFFLLLWLSQDIVIDQNHHPCAISFPKNAQEEIKESARVLQNLIQRSVACEVEFGPELSERQGSTLIWFGTKWLSKKEKIPLSGQSILISFSRPGVITLAGGTSVAYRFCVSEFAERYLGVRFLLPGESGTYIPDLSQIRIPRKNVFSEPAFKGRSLSGLHHPILKQWALNLRMGGGISFSHNLINLIPPENYIKSHPEFFPEIQGIRRLPAKNSIYRWQPCFSAEGLVQECVNNINLYFEQNPERTSYSLGINDSDRFCECSLCLPRYPEKPNTYGFRNASDIYYSWVNSVVEGVLNTYPDKQFGLLAYLNCGDPPSNFLLNKHVIPFMTYDRAKWVVPSIKRKGHKVTKAFLKKCQTIGWYDYLYGCPYLLPRVYFHQMAETYRWAKEQKHIQYVYAESLPNFGEGPKLYLALKLFWNPDLNVDRVLNEWYELAVGEKAAPFLKAYYDHWESFWTHRVMQSGWITDRGQWMWFGEPDYLRLVTVEEIKQSRSLLEKVVNKAITVPQKKRAKLFLKAFEYYEASAYSYWGLVEHRTLEGVTENMIQAMNQKRYQLVESFDSDPLLRHSLRFDKPSILGLDLLNWQPPLNIGKESIHP